MTNSSKFFQRPATKTGYWAGGLAIVTILMFGINSLGLNPFTQTTADEPSFLVVASDLIMFVSFVAASVLGIIALAAKRERSWVVWLFLVPLLIWVGALIWMLFERLSYTGRIETAPTPAANIERMPVIFDDDGSPDGTSALLFLLSDPRVNLLAVNVSYGEAHPQVYIQHLGWLLERYGYGDVPLGAGQDAPLVGNNSFPEFVREASNNFWGFQGGAGGKVYPVQNSPELMVKIILNSDAPVTILASGALTNLAQALQANADIQQNIAAVYVMGGAVDVPGNITGLLPDDKNLVAEWNIYADPQAASEVFASGLKLNLVPLDATNQVTLIQKDTRTWRKGGAISDFAAEIYESRMKAWNRDRIEMWDLMTAEIMMNPEHCTFTPLALEVVTEEGDTQGQTRVVEGKANVNVCLSPKADEIKQTLAEVFGKRK